MSKPERPKFWFWLFGLVAAGTVLGALVVRVLGLRTGRLGSYFGILILVAAVGALVTAIASKVGWKRAVAALFAVTVIGGAAEICGLYTGIPFGKYQYSDLWLPYLWLPEARLYPLLLPFSWFIIVSSCYLVVSRRFQGWSAVLATALVTALVDLVMEAVLTRIVIFWFWLEPTPLLGAPYLNFAGWFGTSLLGAAALHGLGIWRANTLKQPVWMLAAMLFFTSVIGVGHGEFRGAVALLLLPLVWWLAQGAAAKSPSGQ